MTLRWTHLTPPPSHHPPTHPPLHPPLDKMAAISQTIYSDALSWMFSNNFCLKFHWSLFLMIQLTIAQHWFRKWLGAEWRQYIIWTNADLIHWRIYAALGGDELINRSIKMITFWKCSWKCCLRNVGHFSWFIVLRFLVPWNGPNQYLPLFS